MTHVNWCPVPTVLSEVSHILYRIFWQCVMHQLKAAKTITTTKHSIGCKLCIQHRFHGTFAWPPARLNYLHNQHVYCTQFFTCRGVELIFYVGFMLYAIFISHSTIVARSFSSFSTQPRSVLLRSCSFDFAMTSIVELPSRGCLCYGATRRGYFSKFL